MGCCYDKFIVQLDEPLLKFSTYQIILDEKENTREREYSRVRKLLSVTSQLYIEIMSIRSFLLEKNFVLEPMVEPSLYLNNYEIDLEKIKLFKVDFSTMKWKNNHLIIVVLNHEIIIVSVNCSESDKNKILYFLLQF